MSRNRRAFSLVELLAVLGIIAVLAAILFPVFSAAKKRATQTDCQSRLKQFALALQMYRTDNDGLGMPILHGLPNRYPYNYYSPIAAYVKPGEQLWCPTPSRSEIIAYNFLHYKVYHPPVMNPPTIHADPAYAPEPNAVVVYCNNHTTDVVDPRGLNMFEGRYNFAREDGSTGSAMNTQITPWFYWTDGWSKAKRQPANEELQFPGEPFPPKPEG